MINTQMVLNEWQTNWVILFIIQYVFINTMLKNNQFLFQIEIKIFI